MKQEHPELQQICGQFMLRGSESPLCEAQANPGLSSKHTNNVLPVRAINGNREFVRLKRPLEEQQHALQEI